MISPLKKRLLLFGKGTTILVFLLPLFATLAHADPCEDNRARESENIRRRIAQCESERGTAVESFSRQFDFGNNCRFTLPDIRCEYGDARGGDSYYRNNYAGNNVRDRALDGNCAYATEFDGQGGYKCRKAEIAVKEVRDRGAAMQQVSMIGAAAVQVQNSMNVPRDQSQALKQTQSNMKISMAVSAVELASNLQGTRELKGAETDARSAERGIQNARTAYNEAVTEARTKAGAGGANFTRLLSTTNNAQEMKDELERQARRNANQNGASTTGGGQSALSPEIQRLRDQQTERLNAQKEAVNVFDAKLKEAGLDETAKGFNTFDSMNSNTRRGIRESQEVAQQAGAAASTSQMQALGNALQLAQTYAAYRQTKQNTTQLASLPNTPAAIALADPGKAPTVPGVTGGSITPPTTPELNNNANFSPSGPRDPMRGNVIMGGGAPGAPFKGRKADVSSGGGGRGLSGGGGGGGGGGRERGRSANNAITSMDYDGSGGGRYINNGGAGVAQGNSDMQDALAAILGGGEQSADERSKEFREIASVDAQEEGRGDNPENENRTIFERVSEKYGEVISRGDIRLTPLVPAAG